MKKHNIFYLLFFSLFIGCTDESLNISRIDRANNTAVIHVQSKGFQFPSANLNLFIRPFTPIVRTVVSANNFTLP